MIVSNIFKNTNYGDSLFTTEEIEALEKFHKDTLRYIALLMVE